MSTRNTSTTIDASAAVPIDVASKLLLGVRHAYRRAEVEMRHDMARVRLWVERQHLQPDQVMQVAVLVIYGLVAVAEAVAYKHKGR